MGTISDAIEKAIKEANSNQNLLEEHAKSKIPPNNVVSITEKFDDKLETEVDPLLITYHFPASFETEAFKILRTNILFPKEGKPPKTILITSTVPGEGKSFISSNLSISIAQGLEEYVLLIDCDLRKLDIKKKFGLKDLPGLGDYLSDLTTLDKLFIKTPIHKLSVLSGGNQFNNPTELISSNKMANFIKEVKNRYNDRYIIIDSPPLLAAPETFVISKYVDGIIIVIKERGVNRKVIKDTIEMLDQKKIIGVVLNYCEKKRSKYRSL